MLTQIDLVKKYHLSIRGQLGQHLLIDPNVQRKIVELLDLGKRDKVLEIGPGLGALTRHVLEKGAGVLAVEKDEKFVEVLEKELLPAFPKKLKIVSGDILKWIRQGGAAKRFSKSKWRVLGNLPYYISTPILFELIENRKFFNRAVLTVQKEVAQRLLATPGTRDYSRLTLGVRYFCEVEHAFDISPSCFTPRPEVDSSVIVLTFHPEPKLPKVDPDFLFYLIKIAFGQRRKTLLHNLSHADQIAAGREKLEEIFSRLGLAKTVRGEELMLKDYLGLAEELR